MFPVPAYSNTQEQAFLLKSVDSGATIEGEGLLLGHTSRFLGPVSSTSRWFQRVVYRDLYPGIDLVFYNADQRLEDDFVVNPGADPSRIDFAFEGASTTMDDGLVVSAPHNLLFRRARSSIKIRIRLPHATRLIRIPTSDSRSAITTARAPS